MSSKFLAPPEDIVIVKRGLKTLGAPEGPIHTIADASFKRFKSTVLFSFLKGRHAFVSQEFKSTSSLDKAEDLFFKSVEITAQKLEELLVGDFLKTIDVGAKISLSRLQRLKGLSSFSFLRTADEISLKLDAQDTRAAKWAKKHALSLVEDITAVSKKRIRAALAEHFVGDMSRSDLEELIFSEIGDEDRAAKIARTESMTAANAGQREGWLQAVDKKLLTGKERRKWVAVGSACPLCLALDGSTASLTGEYQDGVEGPPLHPDCRCVEGLNI